MSIQELIDDLRHRWRNLLDKEISVERFDRILHSYMDESGKILLRVEPDVEDLFAEEREELEDLRYDCENLEETIDELRDEVEDLRDRAAKFEKLSSFCKNLFETAGKVTSIKDVTGYKKAYEDLVKGIKDLQDVCSLHYINDDTEE